MKEKRVLFTELAYVLGILALALGTALCLIFRRASEKGRRRLRLALGLAVLGHRVGERVYVRVSDDYGYYVTLRAIEKGQDDESLEISAY